MTLKFSFVAELQVSSNWNILSLKFSPAGIIASISPFKQNHTSSFIPGGKMVTRSIKLDCRDDVNFLHILAGRALAEDLREPPLQRLRLRLRRLAVVAGARGIHGRPNVTRSHRGGTASGAPRVGEGRGRKVPGAEEVLGE
uniref:Uncharacterized protein n=1 Tax=Arundo donax TaxID=35708 RepID=A0A0A9G431_ARUDO